MMLDWPGRLVAPLNTVLFHMGADAVSWAELLGFITGAACVYLVVRANVHNFWTGILNSALFLVLFATARLWADASLQFIYIVLGFIGWWQWLHGGQNRTALKVGRASARMLLTCVAFIVLGTLVLTPLLQQAHDIAPFLDALTTSISLAAQFLLNAKKIQNWLFWIAADVIYIPLYFAKHLNLTGLVYVAFLGLAISGALQWRRLESSGNRATSPLTSGDEKATVAA
jgi:nicotinamide mononucleotide transporter